MIDRIRDRYFIGKWDGKKKGWYFIEKDRWEIQGTVYNEGWTVGIIRGSLQGRVDGKHSGVGAL